MRRAILVGAIGLVGAVSPVCAKPKRTAVANSEKSTTRVEEIESSTVGGMDGWRIGVANIWEEKWTRADGREAKGQGVTLDVVDDKDKELPGQRVHEGDVITVAGRKWKLTRIWAPGERGSHGGVQLTEAPEKPATGAAKKNEEKKAMRVEEIENTTVGGADGWRIGVGNIFRSKWTRDDGSEAEGMTAQLFFSDENGKELGDRIVGEGATVTIAGKKWKVTHIWARGERGRGGVQLTEQP
jgi:hypothetical protein